MNPSVSQLLDQLPEPQPHEKAQRRDVSRRVVDCVTGSDADLGAACEALTRAIERGACSPVDDDVTAAALGRIDAFLPGHPQRPIDPALAYNIHKGRILLRTFNPA